MPYTYTYLLYTGLASSLMLLGIELIPRLRILRKPLTAITLTILTALWTLQPQTGRWIVAMWSPGTVLGEQILLDMTPAVWWLGVVLGAVFTGAAWIEVAERRPALPLTGTLVVVALLVTWQSLMGGTLMTTLAAWAIFDLIWSVAALTAGADGQQITFSLALHGVSSLLLWGSALLLRQHGDSTLWWLMQTSEPIQVLLLIAALIRVGFYPFHILFPRRLGESRPLGMVYLIGPIPGIALLYRFLALPNFSPLPAWGLWWGVLSLFWCGMMGWNAHGKQRPMLWAGHALLITLATSTMLFGASTSLLYGVATWIAAGTLLVLMRGRDSQTIAWSWPAWIALLFLVGAPPSPAGTFQRALLATIPWPAMILAVVGSALIFASFLRGIRRPALGNLTFPQPWRRISFLAGTGLILIVLILTMMRSPVSLADLGSNNEAALMDAGVSWLGLGLGMSALLGSTILLRWGAITRDWLHYGEPFLEILNLQWLYQAMWRGANHLLALLRVTVEVIEGSGAILWSLLILLLTLLVIVSR
ncbi:MAG: hypothetical protein ACLFTI_00650 [Anaerolineales bacterium]